jgi:outer membrane protein assembly factor BamB
MNKMLVGLAASTLVLTAASAGEPRKEADADRISFGANDWPWWRGPNRNGIAAAQTKLPLKWSDSENVLWKSPVPGRGHGSPIVVGDQVFLATADAKSETQSVLCYNRQTGKLLWQTEVHRGGFEKGGNGKSSLASGTVACDGQRVFVNFLHDKAIYATALSRSGEKLWQTKITDYVLHQGFASSPAVYGPLVIVTADNKGTGVIAGLERATGKIVWKQDRPRMPNYASPIILNVAGREQLLLTGCELVASFEPLTGKKLWEFNGSTTECVTSIVTDGQNIFISGGYPKDHIAAVRADGSGEKLWEIKTRVYVPSMVAHAGYLYAIQDGGLAMCMKWDTGKLVWKERLDGNFSASPVLAGDHLFATNESGVTYIFKADPEAYVQIAKNKLGDEALATPTICGDRIYMRVAVRTKGQRQEMLYCIGK